MRFGYMSNMNALEVFLIAVGSVLESATLRTSRFRVHFSWGCQTLHANDWQIFLVELGALYAKVEGVPMEGNEHSRLHYMKWRRLVWLLIPLLQLGFSELGTHGVCLSCPTGHRWVLREFVEASWYLITFDHRKNTMVTSWKSSSKASSDPGRSWWCTTGSPPLIWRPFS